MWRITFGTPWGKLQNLLGMKLTTNVTLLALSAVNNNITLYFLCHRCRLWNQFNPSTVCCFELVFWHWAHTFIKVTGKIKLVHEIDLVCDCLKHPKRLLITNRESPELSLYTFKSVCRTTLETPWGKLHILLGMKLITDVIYRFF